MFSCASCPMTYPRRWLLQRHVDTKHSSAQHKCELCPAHDPKWFKRKDTLQRHLQTKHSPPLQASMKKSSTTCSKCRKSFLRADYTRKHEERCHRLANPPPEPQAQWSPPRITPPQVSADGTLLSSEPTHLGLSEQPPSQIIRLPAAGTLPIPEDVVNNTMQALFSTIQEADMVAVGSILVSIHRDWDCTVDMFAHAFDLWVQSRAFLDDLPLNAMGTTGIARFAKKFSLFSEHITTDDFLWTLCNLLIASKAGRANRLLAHIFVFTCGTSSVVSRLLIHTQKINFNMQNLAGETALIRAIRNRDSELVCALLNISAVDINIQDGHGRTAMMHAIIQRSSDHIQALLRTGRVDLNIQDSSGTTALMLTTSWWSTDEVEVCDNFIRSCSSNVNFQDYQGSTALMQTAIHLAEAHETMQPNVNFIQALLRTEGIDVNAQDRLRQTALIHASRGSPTAIVEALLAHSDIDLNVSDVWGSSALLNAMETRLDKPTTRSLSIIEMLLNTGFEDSNTQSSDGVAIMMHAIRKGDPDLLRLLLLSGQIDYNQRDDEGMTALMVALCENSGPCMVVLLAAPEIDVNSQDFHGHTALMYAGIYGADIEIVGLLLSMPQLGLNVRDHSGANALFHATQENRRDIVTALLCNEEIEVNAKDLSGFTVFIFAASEGCVDIIKLLLADGRAKINVQDYLGRTALMYAVRLGHQDVVEVLLAAEDIDIHVRDLGGRTARMFRSHDEVRANAIAEMLEAAGDVEPRFDFRFKYHG